MSLFVTTAQPIVGEYDFSFAALKWNISGTNYGTAVVTVYIDNSLVGAHQLSADSNTWAFGPDKYGDGSSLSGTFTLTVPTAGQLGTLNVTCAFTPVGQSEQSYSRTLIAWDINGNAYSS